MNNDNLQTPCNSCGRPMQYCSCSGGCNKCGDIKFSEYGCKHNACIRNKQPECPYTAVIPSVTVEDISNIKDLADCFVHVSKINTTFYIDDKHRITSVWQGPVEVNSYDIEENPLNLRSQFLFDYETGYVVYFNAQGKPMHLNDIDAIIERLEPELQEKINNKLDQMAASGELAELLAEFLKANIKVIFPSYNIDGDDTLGDCTIIKTANKVMMVDTFSDSVDTFSGIITALAENEIQKIDYLLITHYDGDHFGNLSRLVNSNYLTNATVILPRDVVTASINKTGTELKNILDAAGINWVIADNETLSLDTGVTARLFNASEEDYAYYNNLGETNYNNYSVCTEIEAHNRRILLPGDADTTACGYIADKYLKQGYDLLKDNHHGFCGYDIDYAKKVSPSYVVIPASAGMIKSNLGRRGTLTAYWSECTQHIYVQGTQPSYIAFTIGVSDVKVITDTYETPQFSSNGLWTYNLDSTTSSKIRNGSDKYPFKTLAEAAAMMPKHSPFQINLQVTNLDDMEYAVNFTGYKRLHINFHSKDIKNTITFTGIETLGITNAKCSGSGNIVIDSCKSCKVNGFSSSAAVDNQITVANSDVQFMGGIESSNAVQNVIRATYSTVSFSNSSLAFASDTAHIINAYGTNITMTDGAANLFKNYKLCEQVIAAAAIRQCNINQMEKLSELFTSDTVAYSNITLKESINNYNYVRILASSSDGYKQIVEFKVDSTGYLINDFLPSGSTTDLYSRICRVKIADTTVTIDRNCQFNFASATNAITVQAGDKMGILKIWGVVR